MRERPSIKLDSPPELGTGCSLMTQPGMWRRHASGPVLNFDPLRESANRILIAFHLRGGNRLDALRKFSRYKQLLDKS